MMKSTWMILCSSLTFISNVGYANEDGFSVNTKDVKPSALQKELGISRDLATKFVAYQAEYGVPKSISDIKPNEYLSASEIGVLKDRFKLKLNYCEKSPLLCKGNPIFVLPYEKLVEIEKLQKQRSLAN